MRPAPGSATAPPRLLPSPQRKIGARSKGAALLAVALCLTLASPSLAQEKSGAGKTARAGEWKGLVAQKLDADLPTLDKLYKHLHTHPELAHEEEKTAALLAKE